MTAQTTIGAAFTIAGPGLHTGRRSTVTLRPAVPGYGWRLVGPSEPRLACPMTWANRVPSIMSTSIALGAGRAVRTVEHLMASLAAFAVDNVLVEIDGAEVPILDGSARRWCDALQRVGLVEQRAQRRVVRVRKPVQIWSQGGFLRAEPAPDRTIDLTYDLLPDFPVMRWAGMVDRDTFVGELAASRSFGNLDWRKLLRRPPAPPRRPEESGPSAHALDESLPTVDGQAMRDAMAQASPAAAPAPVLRGARPGRAALVVGRTILPFPRYPDEPIRHVALDMIGDLALAGAPLVGRIVAHNPSHEKTYMLVAALMRDRSAWSDDTCP